MVKNFIQVQGGGREWVRQCRLFHSFSLSRHPVARTVLLLGLDAAAAGAWGLAGPLLAAHPPLRRPQCGAAALPRNSTGMILSLFRPISMAAVSPQGVCPHHLHQPSPLGKELRWWSRPMTWPGVSVTGTRVPWRKQRRMLRASQTASRVNQSTCDVLPGSP